jgi:hypothetical protein
MHPWRRARRAWIAGLATGLAGLTFLTGFSIAPFVGPITIVALVVAALAVPPTRRVG